MAAQESQIVDPQEFIDILDYKFTGDESTVGKKRCFVEAYREHGSIYHAAQVAGIHRATYYNWAERDPAFQQAVEDSKEDCYDQVETSVFKKAINGGTLESFFYLKAHRPKFRDKVSVDVEVVRSEIEERLDQLNLRQLPAAVMNPLFTESLSSQSLHSQNSNNQPNSPEHEQLQKEESGE